MKEMESTYEQIENGIDDILGKNVSRQKKNKLFNLFHKSITKERKRVVDVCIPSLKQKTRNAGTN